MTECEAVKIIQTRQNSIITEGSVSCLAKDQHQNCYLMTARHLLPDMRKHISFCGGLLHFRDELNQDHFHHWNICYGVYKRTKLNPAGQCRRQYIVNLALILIPKIDLLGADELSVSSKDNSDFLEDVEDDSDTQSDSVEEEESGLILVEKNGCGSGHTHGIVIEEDYSFKNCEGFFLVVCAKYENKKVQLEHEKQFAVDKDCGAMVVLTQSCSAKKSALGIVLDVEYCNNFQHSESVFGGGKITYKHVTLCLYLNHCLEFLRNKWGFKLTLFNSTNAGERLKHMKKPKFKRSISH